MNQSRYSRQILFDGIGREGQEAISRAAALVVGCGALGASHSEMLARAGVGRLRIVDRDFVEVSNLQRQTLFTEKDATEGLPKAVAAQNRLSNVNSEISIEGIVADVNASNVSDFVSDMDVVIDGTDNFQVRYLVNDICVSEVIPWIYGAAVSSYGTSMTVLPGETPCLRCVFAEMPPAGSAPTCDTAGVIQPIIALISSIQVTEALKLLAGRRDLLHGSLVQADVWNSDWRKIKLTERDPECICCGNRDFEFLNPDKQDILTTLCGRNAVQIVPAGAAEIDLKGLANSLSRSLEVKENEYLVRFEAEGKTITLFRDARAIIQGTDDISAARSLYSKYVGS